MMMHPLMGGARMKDHWKKMTRVKTMLSKVEMMCQCCFFFRICRKANYNEELK
jgi:hypothetical protein